MNKSIKNFIKEGEKKFEEFYDKYNSENGGLLYPNRTKDKLKQFISSRQISLIKMIVEEISKTPTTTTSDKMPPFRVYEMTGKEFKDTISSKLKELTDGKQLSKKL